MDVFTVGDQNAAELVDTCVECQNNFAEALQNNDSLGMLVAFSRLMSETLVAASDICSDEALRSRILDSSLAIKSNYIKYGF